MKRTTENVTGNRPNMDRKRCSERSTDDGDLENKDEENVIIETTMVQCLESRMQTDIIATNAAILSANSTFMASEERRQNQTLRIDCT